MNEYPRDMVGYGQKRLRSTWPDGSKIAVQFVLNYEEGAENSILHGDPASEIFLSEILENLVILKTEKNIIFKV